MPIKYSHVKKRSASRTPRRNNKSSPLSLPISAGHAHRNPTPHLDRSITQAMTAVDLERRIARLFLLRFEQDISRLYSTRLHNVILSYLPKLMLESINAASPGWAAANANSDEVKDCFRAAISMDLRQAGERVATKSVLWSYTALRHFALSNNVSICEKRGLHSLRLLPYYDALKSHVDALEAMPVATFSKPAHLSSLREGLEFLHKDISRRRDKTGLAWDNWQMKVRIGYERMVETLWRVAKEFHIQGYGIVLREKLTTKWCDCGCSTDHLGEVCEQTVREDEEDSGVRSGKEREWDGRGTGVYGWQTEGEEDLWEIDLNLSGLELDESNAADSELTIGESIECRYFEAERAKELGNKAFRLGDYHTAIKQYTAAYDVEPELPYYQLNIAAAHLKLSNWMAAENACNVALNQHRSSKGYWRRAKARKELGRHNEAIKDLRALLKLQPSNTEALAELGSLLRVDHVAFLQKDEKSDEYDRKKVGSTSSSFSGEATSIASQSVAAQPNGRGPVGRMPPTALPKMKPPRPLPFLPNELDTRKLHFTSVPLQVEMPVSGSFAEAKAKSAHAKAGLTTKLETFLYPSWDRCVVQKAVQ